MVQTTYIVLLSLAAAASCFDGSELDHTGCPKAFGGLCSCGYSWYKAWKPDGKVFMTNCTNTGFTDANKLQYVPGETEVLIFQGNTIRQLSWDMIWKNRTELQVIDLSNNRIQEMQGIAFNQIPWVKILILNDNELRVGSSMNQSRIFSNFVQNFVNLEELHLTNAFAEQVDSKWSLTDLKNIFLSSQLRKLQKLHLEQNRIWEIKDKDMFCDLPALLDIHLGDNQLTDISFSLDCLERLRYVDLSYNKFRNIKQSTLNLIDKVFAGTDKKIDLHGNPFHCDCEMNELYDWLRTKTERDFLANKREMRCYDGFPDVNSGKRIVNIDVLQCAPMKVHRYDPTATSHYAITSTLLTILILVTTTLLLVVLWINRITVKEKFSPLIENFKTSLQYSTLEKQEETPEVHV